MNKKQSPSKLWLESKPINAVVQKKHTIRKHGLTWSDPYFWLREKSNPAVMRVLEAENDHFKRELRPLKKTVDRLFREMKRRVPPADSSAPAPWGPYEYRSEFRKGAQYRRHLRRLCGSKKDEIVLDENVIARGKKYFDLGGLTISPDHQHIAYAADFDGSEKYSIRIRNLETGKDSSEQLVMSSGSMIWASDCRHLFYVVIDKNLRPYRVYRHERGRPAKTDVLVFEEKDPQQFVHVSRSSSGQFIFIESHGKITAEIWYLRASDPRADLRCFAKRDEGHEYSVDHAGDRFYILSNLRSRNFQVFETSSHRPLSAKGWRLLDAKTGMSAKTDEVYRVGLHAFKGFLVLQERYRGLPQMRILDLTTQRNHVVHFPDAAYDVDIDGANYEFETDMLRLTYSSPVQPTQTLAYNMKTRRFVVLKEEKVKGYDPRRYRCERVMVKSHDGTRVPMTLLSLRSRKPGGPGYLYGYGSYGYSMPDSFGMIRSALSLVDRGFVYAIAHIRGGSEMGRKWYDDGKFLKKMNTFKDFIACGDHLIRSGLVDKRRLGCAGGSAGGMLVGASMNLRPELFSAVAAHVPFVDVLNTMMDASLPLTPIEYKEWGNPAEKKYFNLIRRYSPYDNVQTGELPYLFITAGLNDPRVTYWEPAKWVARLRERRTNNKMLMFKINTGAGHFGASGRFHHLVEKAEEYAFMLKALS